MINSDARPDALIGSTLAERYRLTRKIGEGGMGTVYEATHVVIAKPVAVKVLREKYVDRPEVAQRLVQEARLASSIRHEHIVDITDSGRTEDGRTFVVMELLDGQSLAELLRHEGPLPEPRAISLVRQVASALGAAHERRIVHRDVKPENIFLVEREGRDFVKVVDFGISKSMRAGEEPAAESLRLTHTGMVLGTPLYMSPEQARGDEDLDHRIDIYALGVILYECLTGEVPFRGTNYNGIIAQVANQEATPPRKLRPELRISEAAERVVTKAMAKSRDERYPTMEAFAADLQRVEAGDAVEAPLPVEKRDGRAWWQIPALALILIAGGVAAFLGGKARERASPSVPRPIVSPAPVVILPPPPPPKSIVLHVETTPPGAEVRQGDRVFGLAPRDVMLPRSSVPTRLTFHLDGYDVGIYDAVPAADDNIRVKLTARPKPKKPPRRAAPPPPPVSDKPKPDKKPADETLPNPYR
jgi:serine/threonine-protein kinase